MKRTLILLLSICITVMAQAVSPTSISVVSTAGGLSTAITTAGGDLTTVTNLTVTGTIDARDFKTMRDDMPALTDIDLSGVDVAEYYGIEGTSEYIDSYLKDRLPNFAFSSCVNLKTIVLPTSITGIMNGAFEGCSQLVYIVIPNSVTYIDIYAFQDCFSLESVLLSNQLTYISSSTFRNCTSLSSINIPSSVTSIRDHAFFNCTSLITVTLPSDLINIFPYAFYNSTNLRTINFPDKLSFIGSQAFWYCKNLSSVTIGPAVDLIDENAFAGLDGEIIVHPLNQNYSSEGGVLFNKEKTILIHYPTLSTGKYIIPNTVELIEDSAFADCNLIDTLYIPLSVTSAGYNAFTNCTGLKDIYVYTQMPPFPLDLYYENLDLVFTNVIKSACVLHVPIGAKANYLAAEFWQDFMVVEDVAAAVDIEKAGNVIATVQNNQLFLTGMQINDELSIYNTQGVQIVNTIASDSNFSVGLPLRGVYVVRVGDQSIKVVN